MPRELLSPALWRRSVQKFQSVEKNTGLTPNILARIGFCMSLNDPTPPDPAHYLPESDREIDRHTLTGAWDNLFVALIKERCRQDELDEEALYIQFKAHMNRDILLLNKRVQTLTDLAILLPPEFCDAATGNGHHAGRSAGVGSNVALLY